MRYVVARDRVIEDGSVFGKWTCIGDPYYKDAGHVYIRCVCSCGARRDVYVYSLVARPGDKQRSTSCGECNVQNS